MSWSVNLIGTPEGVKKALDAEGERLSGQSQIEFLEAKPHLQALIEQIVGQNVKLIAAGHATFNASEGSNKAFKTFGHVSVSIEPLYGKFLE
jgi:hypothetical protein